MTVVASILVSLGVALMAISAIGVLRLPDVFSRMHAASKSTSLGLTFVLVGVGLFDGSTSVIVKAALASVLLIITQPVAAHVLGRAAHRAGVSVSDETRWDDLRDRVELQDLPDVEQDRPS